MARAKAADAAFLGDDELLQEPPTMVSPAPALDLAPASFKALVDRLPPSKRADIAWFLPELRATCVEPLRAITDDEELLASLDDHLVRFALLNAKLTAALLPLLREAALRDVVVAVDEERVVATHEKIVTRVGAVDPYAADALRESYAWLIAILPALVQHIGGLDDVVISRMTAATEAVDEAVLRRELQGEGRALFQLMAFTLAAIEAVEDDARELPSLIVSWCELALDSVHAVVPALRREGLVIPTPPIPGVTQREWRNRWAAHVSEGMTREQLESVASDIRRSSSTHRTSRRSDWFDEQ